MRVLVIIAAVAHAYISPNGTRALLDDALEGIAAKLRYHGRAFIRAEPFPHVVIDGLFPAAVVEALATEIPERFDYEEAIRQWGVWRPDEGGRRGGKAYAPDEASPQEPRASEPPGRDGSADAPCTSSFPQRARW